MTHNTIIDKDLANRKVHISRAFDAPVAAVWSAWTEPGQLDKWWAPKPWRAETKSMDFKPGGAWLYCMAGPEGERHWCRVDYKAITPQQNISADDTFTDENSQPTPGMAVTHWFIQFNQTENGSAIEVELVFDTEADLRQLVEMGFESGFSMALENLDGLLASGKK